MSRDQSGLRLRHRRVSDTGTTASTANFMDDVSAWYMQACLYYD